MTKAKKMILERFLKSRMFWMSRD